MTDMAEIIAKSISQASAPDLIDYLSLIISAIGIVISGLAIWFAVSVPVKIGTRQDKIALFDKRFEFYDVLRQCIGFARMIQNIQTKNEIRLFFIASFGREVIKSTDEETLNQRDVLLRWHVTTVLDEGVFLFEFETKQWLQPLISSISIIGSVEETHEKFWEYYSDFMDAIRNVKDNLLPQVEQSLRL